MSTWCDELIELCNQENSNDFDLLNDSISAIGMGKYQWVKTSLQLFDSHCFSCVDVDGNSIFNSRIADNMWLQGYPFIII